MNKTELESKHLAELHALAAAAGIDRYRMLTRAELVEKLVGADPQGEDGGSGGEKAASERPKRRRRPAAPKPEEAPGPAAAPAPAAEPGRPKRRRRRRFGRRKDRGITLPDLLLPPEPGRQTVLCAESREACTALLRGVAADLAGAEKGPDPIALLVDPSPEELADWKREAPRAEIVAAGQARHADDALAAAVRRAGSGEDVILLIDSLNRLGEAYEDSAAAKELFDSGRVQGGTGGGSLTVVAALERPTSD